jgi:hypothetical protein
MDSRSLTLEGQDMTDNTKPEALDLAEWLEAVGGGPSAKRCAALLREQHARIAELESELEAVGAGGVSGPMMGQPQAMPDLTALTERGAKAWTAVDAQALREGRWYMVTHGGVAALCEDRRDAEKEAKDADMAWPHSGPHRAVQLVEASTAGFTAADMATASAQGFRDGVASVAANAREPVYQARYQKWFWQDSSRECYEYLQSPENTCAEDWETRILYTHPPTAQAEGWRPISTAPRDGTEVLADTSGLGRVVVYWDDEESQWGTGLGYLDRGAPTHWMPLPPPPTSAEGVEHGRAQQSEQLRQLQAQAEPRRRALLHVPV